MSEPTPVEEPTAEQITLAELDRAINDAARERIAAQRARPRDPQRIADAEAEYRALLDMRAELYG